MDATEPEGPIPPDATAGKGGALALGERVAREVERVVVGMAQERDLALAAVLAGGHALLEGPPGVAKTLLVRTLAAALGLRFGRVQFTPDLLPPDVIGTSVFRPNEGEFRFRQGPVFCDFLLCDEINRAPAKTQSALLEAMQEGAVTVDGCSHRLPEDFTVFATMNPLEYEGTYPLPEAQLDRFLLAVRLGHPSVEDEVRVLAAAHGRPRAAAPQDLGVRAVSGSDEIRRVREQVRGLFVREDLVAYVARLLAATRETPSLVLGASPRAGVMLLQVAKALAALEGRDFASPDDVKRAFLPAMRHRVALDPAEEIEGGTVDDVLRRILETVEVPR